MKKLLALLLALVMVLGLAACGGPAPKPTEPPTTPPTAPPTAPPTTPPTEPPTEPTPEVGYQTIPALSPDNDPYIEVKYTVEVTADGWTKVVNKGGDTLGISPNSGVNIIQVGGYAFKDLDKDGKLDGYEDWRNTAEERAADLVSQMTGPEMAALMSHGGWGSFSAEAVADDTLEFIQAGGRGGVTRSASNGADHAKWNNLVQEACEAQPWGIPGVFSIDPMEISGMIETIALGATFDVELAAAIGRETAKQYRALGVSMLLGPQVDLTTAIMERASGTYSEDPRLTRDIAQAYVNGMQSTYAEDGTDLGWGVESVYCMTKHFAGAGAGEGGRDDHRNPGRYAVFAGDNYAAHVITYFDGTFNLPGLTKASGVMTQYAVNVGPDGKPYGGEWGGAYNPFVNQLLHNNWDGLSVTDWGIHGANSMMANWGVEDKTVAESIAIIWEQGGDLQGGLGDMEAHAEAWNLLVKGHGEEEALEIIQKHAYDFILVEMNLELFENPYCDTAYAAEVAFSDAALAYGLETQAKSVVMLKNDGTIKAAVEGAEKPTVYVPYIFTAAEEGSSGNTPASWGPCTDVETLKLYFDVVEDTVGEPSGTDADGNAVYTEADIIRASADDIAACDYIFVSMEAPFTGSSVVDNEDGTQTWLPASIQYGEYTATASRETSIGGKETKIYDNYGSVIATSKENRSYLGNSVGKASNYGDLEMLQYVDSVAGDVPVIVSMTTTGAMIWSEVEPLADVILLNYKSERLEAVCDIILGNVEPYGLLPIQQPASMDDFEVALEDVPRDVKCYKDAAGNEYDFAFGLNWSGVINDDRVATYSVDPLTEVEADIVWPEK